MNKLEKYISDNKLEFSKLHLGCGGEYKDGYINIDLYPHNDEVNDRSRAGCVADIFMDIRNLGMSDNVIDEIFTSHTFEHFTKWEAIKMTKEWYRMLKSDGRVVIEMPSFWPCVFGLFVPIPKIYSLAKSQFYGNQEDELEYETHRYLWTRKEVRRMLKEVGFKKVNISWFPETHVIIRDMRIEAVK